MARKRNNDVSIKRYHELYKTMDVNQYICIYCHRESEICEYVPPIEHAGAYSLDSVFLLVPVCEECISLLDGCYEDTVSKRALHLFSRYGKEYHNALTTPDWSELELQEMSLEFAREIKPILEGKLIANNILNNLNKVASQNCNIKTPDKPIPSNDSISRTDAALHWEDSPETFSNLEMIDRDNLQNPP